MTMLTERQLREQEHFNKFARAKSFSLDHYSKPEFGPWNAYWYEFEQVRREYIPYMESVVAFFEQRSLEVLGHEPPQILLMHASQLNADLMPELLAMFRRRGYHFVTLSQALQAKVTRTGL